MIRYPNVPYTELPLFSLTPALFLWQHRVRRGSHRAGARGSPGKSGHARLPQRDKGYVCGRGLDVPTIHSPAPTCTLPGQRGSLTRRGTHSGHQFAALGDDWNSAPRNRRGAVDL